MGSLDNGFGGNMTEGITSSCDDDNKSVNGCDPVQKIVWNRFLVIILTGYTILNLAYYSMARLYDQISNTFFWIANGLNGFAWMIPSIIFPVVFISAFSKILKVRGYRLSPDQRFTFLFL